MSTGPADKKLDTFKTLVWDLYVQQAIAAIVVLIPFSTWGFFSFLAGPVGFIVGGIVSAATNALYKLLRQGVNFGVILLTNAQHHAAYVKASGELQSIFDKNGMNSAEFLEARNEHKKALATFVRFSGT